MSGKGKDISAITQKLLDFRKERDWEKFHNPKDIAISLALEAAEVLEHFQWKSEAEIRAYIRDNKAEIGEELADVFNWILLLAHDLDIDIVQAAQEKIAINGRKYPVEKSKGRATKYTKL